MFLVNSHPIFMSLKTALILKPSSLLHNQRLFTILVVISIVLFVPCLFLFAWVGMYVIFCVLQTIL